MNAYKNDINKLNLDPIVNLKNVINNISQFNFDFDSCWQPELYIANALGEVKEEIKSKLEVVEKESISSESGSNQNSLTIRVYEFRKIKGVLYVWHF